MYELMFNLFVTASYKPSGLRAKNINTIDEVPDSSWFTNRIGTRAITNEELLRAANVGEPPDPSKWVLIREKSVRRAPGLHGDGRERRDLVPRSSIRRSFAEGATAAVAIATKIFWALGYNQVESFLTDLRPEERVDRPEGDRPPPERQENAVSPG